MFYCFKGEKSSKIFVVELFVFERVEQLSFQKPFPFKADLARSHERVAEPAAYTSAATGSSGTTVLRPRKERLGCVVVRRRDAFGDVENIQPIDTKVNHLDPYIINSLFLNLELIGFLV